MTTRIYTKTVTGTQWTGDNADEMIALMGAGNFEDHGEGGNPDDLQATASFRDDHKGGTWRPLLTGAWVLRDDDGDWHTDSRFEATYRESVDADPS